MSKITLILTLALTALLAACNTTIYPDASGGYSSVTTSASLNGAETNAQKDIEAHCKKLGKGAAIHNHNYEYHGTTTGNKIVGAVIGGIFLPGYNPAISDEDYVVKTRFRCR